MVDHIHSLHSPPFSSYITTSNASLLTHSNNAPHGRLSLRLRPPLPPLVVAPLVRHRGRAQKPPAWAARLAHRREPLPSGAAAASLHLRNPRLT